MNSFYLVVGAATQVRLEWTAEEKGVELWMAATMMLEGAAKDAFKDREDDPGRFHEPDSSDKGDSDD